MVDELSALDPYIDFVRAHAIWVAAAAGLILLLLAVWLWSRKRPGTLEKTLTAISFERLDNVVLPKADDGEIHIQHILLTAGGIYVVDPKEVKGIVFGSDKMHDWTVLDQGRRFTIANPQGPLFDRVAAVKQVVANVPVKGCIVFGAQADFTKGWPSHVYTEASLREELPRIDAEHGRQLRASFDADWQKLRDAAFSGA